MAGGFLYILQSLAYGIYYIGSAVDPEKRLLEHNAGKTKSTRNKGPWILKFKQFYPTIAEARRIEYRLKKLKRRDVVEKIIQEGAVKMKSDN